MSETSLDLKKLTAEFPPKDVEIKALAVKGDQCLAVPYLDARQVAERLDAVFGCMGWDVEHYPAELTETEWKNGTPVEKQILGVRARLSVRGENGEIAVKEDFGFPEGDQGMKGAASDGLKRCAVLLGIGRYLYALPKMWAPYDSTKKRPVAKNLAELLGAAPKEPALPPAKPPVAKPPASRPASAPKSNTAIERSQLIDEIAAYLLEDGKSETDACAEYDNADGEPCQRYEEMSIAQLRVLLARCKGIEPENQPAGDGTKEGHYCTCGKRLTEKEIAYCQQQQRDPPTCYNCQRKENQ